MKFGVGRNRRYLQSTRGERDGNTVDVKERERERYTLNHPRMTAKCWQNVLPEAGFEPGTSSMVQTAPLTTTPRRPTVIFGAHGRRGTIIEFLKKQKDADCRELPVEIKIMRFG